MPFKTTINWLFNDTWCYFVFRFSTNSCKALLYPENVAFQNVSLKGLERKQNALKLEILLIFCWGKYVQQFNHAFGKQNLTLE